MLKIIDATKEEIECIKLSNNIRKRYLYLDIKYLEKQTKLFVSYNQFINDFELILDDNDKLRIRNNFSKYVLINRIYIILFLIFIKIYVIFFYFVFSIIRFFEGIKNKIFFKRDKIILKQSYILDYRVSNIKTFDQLWEDKGLVGLEDNRNFYYDETEKLELLNKWIKILYGFKNKKDFKKFLGKVYKESYGSIIVIDGHVLSTRKPKYLLIIQYLDKLSKSNKTYT